jgi:L-gulono-1,4-lactone dehydrogenase
MTESSWQNWAGNQCCAPTEVRKPESEEELATIVADASRQGRRVKAVGTGHSFTGIALTDGIMLQLERYNDVLAHDPAAGTVTVQAGITIASLSEKLHELGFALENLGDINYQTISGAIATATHGTGVRLGGIATQVVGMRLVAGDGSLIECSADVEPEVFRAARVGLGALGLVSTVTLRVVPAFNLHAVEAGAGVDRLLDNLDGHVENNDHFEFFWMPHTGAALAKWNNRSDEPERERDRWRELREDYIFGNLSFDVICRIGRQWPNLIPRLNNNLPGSSRNDYVDRSYRVFASPRLVKFHEMEYAIPAEHAREAIGRIRDFIDKSGLKINFPLEVRFTAGDDIPLSTAYGRTTCYLAVHLYLGMPYQQYFEGVEAIMDDYGGRPHWGKLHFQTAATLAQRYPEWEAFQSVRRRLDPEGTFANAYLDRVLGRTVGTREPIPAPLARRD